MAISSIPFGIRTRPITLGRRMSVPLGPMVTRTLERAEAATAEPFVGITADGHLEPGLFPLHQTGVSTLIEEDSTFYYRVQSPLVLIEFDHLRGIALDNEEPARTHIHTIVRTPNGNDYGRDLLRQHYAQHHR